VAARVAWLGPCTLGSQFVITASRVANEEKAMELILIVILVVLLLGGGGWGYRRWRR